MDISEKKTDVSPAALNVETSSTEKNMTEKEIAFGTNEDGTARFDATQTKALLRKCDKVLLPFLALLYLLSFLDRTNIGNAKLAGLEEDLNMTGKWDYNVSCAKLSRRVLTANSLTKCRSRSLSSSPSTSQLRSHPTWP